MRPGTFAVRGWLGPPTDGWPRQFASPGGVIMLAVVLVSVLALRDC